MEEIAIYPYNDSYAPVVRHQQLMAGIKVKSLISPRGWGMNGDHIQTDSGELRVSGDFLSEMDQCSAVWFVDDAHISLPEETLKRRLADALQQNKRILFTRQSSSEDIKRMIPPEKEIIIEKKCYSRDRINRACFNINTPVIFILGITENTDKFEVQAALREQFIKQGYTVSSISSRRDSAILGMHPLPDFMFDASISETEKILSYSHYIKQIELNENPEVIIIGIPGGVFRFSKTKHNHFGITAFEISNALTCDCAVLCSPYLDYSLDYFQSISNAIKEKLGFPITYHHIAARIYENNVALPSEAFNWLTLNEAYIDRKIQSYKRNDVYNLLKQVDIELLTGRIIDQLSDIPNVKSI